MTCFWKGSLSVVVAVALAAACSNSSDHPPPAGDSTSNGGASGAGGDGGRAIADAGEAGTSEAGASLCVGAIQQGTVVEGLTVMGDPPAPLGGSVQPGSYLLTEIDAYGGSGPADGGDMTDAGASGSAGRGTLVVAGNTIVIIGARGTNAASVPADTVSAVTFTVVGTSLQTTSVCPTAGKQQTIPYSAVGGALALFVDARHRELYAKQ